MQRERIESADDRMQLVWDLPVRIHHWLLAIAVTGSFISHYAGAQWFRVHRYCGYAVFVLVGFRVIWGFAGTYYARFAEFVRGPREILRYLRSGDINDYAGHNPLGAWSVLALLTALAVQVATGLFANDEIASSGPLYGWISHELSNRLTGLHHSNSDVLIALIVVHLAAIAWYTWRRRSPLVRAMITGRKALGNVVTDRGTGGPRWRLAVFIVALLSAALAVIVRTAPEASVVLF